MNGFEGLDKESAVESQREWWQMVLGTKYDPDKVQAIVDEIGFDKASAELTRFTGTNEGDERFTKIDEWYGSHEKDSKAVSG